MSATPGAAGQLELRRVTRTQDHVLVNLLQLYCHDMAEWFALDAGEDGRYHFPTAPVWDAAVHVHLARIAGIPVGFALVRPAAATEAGAWAYDLDAFFVVRRHRRGGIGSAMAHRLWDGYPGTWQVRVYHGNRPALPFWRRCIGRYGGGRHREEERSIADRRWSFFHLHGGAQRDE